MRPYPHLRSVADPYLAQLRVYEPLAAFEDVEREHWQEYVRAGSAPSAEQGPALERAASLAALLRPPPERVPQLPEHAYVVEVDGVTLVCPWRTRLRGLTALAQVRAELPEVLADAVLPAAAEEAAEAALLAERAQHAERRVHLRSSPWQVPLQWFVLVDGQERQVSLGTPAVPGRAAGPGGSAEPASAEGASWGAGRRSGRSLVYRTAMSRARRRTARALAVLRRSVDDNATSGVEDLGRWLEDFHPRSLVELDYGGLVHLLDDDAMAQDESARDVAEALAALDEGAGDRALAAYARVSARMKALQSVESAS